jgi:two-component system NtrC family sensor kinase
MKFRLPDDEPQLIGRSSEALPLTDGTVSRRHAELTPDGSRWVLRDLDSANGTFLNGQLVAQQHELKAGDQIRCGSTVLVFTIAQDEPARPAPVQLLPAEAFDTSIEAQSDSSDDSMLQAMPAPGRAAMDHLRVIYELTALTASTIDRDELLERVMDLVFDELHPDRGFILLQESVEDRPDPVVVRYRELPKTRDEGRIPVSRTIVQHVIGERQGILATNAMNDSRFQSGDSIRAYGIRSAICAPILSGDRLFGVIHVDSSLANFTFDQSQLDLLTAIGRHAGLAMRSAEGMRSRIQTERLAAMGETVASISHSIKNILQGLRGGADAVELALNKNSPELAREGWGILSRNLDRIFALTMNMLAYARPSTLEIELGSLHELIEDVVDLARPQAERRNVGLLFDLAEDMPPVPFDTNALHQALMNLVTNAIEAVPVKSGIVTVRTQYQMDASTARIDVSDNGPGIDPAQQEAIFDAFSSTKGQRGTGLGLAVTKKLIGEHDGEVRLHSTPGAGSVFSIILPCDVTASDAGATRLPRPRATSGGDDLE